MLRENLWRMMPPCTNMFIKRGIEKITRQKISAKDPCSDDTETRRKRELSAFFQLFCRTVFFYFTITYYKKKRIKSYFPSRPCIFRTVPTYFPTWSGEQKRNFCETFLSAGRCRQLPRLLQSVLDNPSLPVYYRAISIDSSLIQILFLTVKMKKKLTK